ncbi:acyl-homoserine-lactone acylase [Novosphingobium kunmingense]|uniref:Acyl-homoserine-lactone acylase n=1 Tax=Novosphingobium kunmingense TaxID=1211806 RepID=A0A2N0HKG1_9SPHN|nr:penicillin acylase family protein [Novosphingobium kunmingense]PKB19358.1 acyl-homoserine-lactone acylase [Novosphingobium kunmingense]
MRRTVLTVVLPFVLAAPALAAPYRAEIRRDDWGIAHVSGRTDADAVFGMIYAQAEDDFNRIEMNYLTSLGRRAEAEGEAALWQDLRQRLWIDPADLQARYAKSPVWLKKLMQGWAAGLNQYLADHPAVKPRVLTRFEPWMALSFSEGSIGGDIESVSLSQLQAFYEKRAIALTDSERGIAPREPSGSNGFVIAPSHSASGHPLLLINPHTSFFFRSEQQVTSGEGLNAYGAATWGQFFIYQGFNAEAGWMHTSAGVDNIDEYAETVTKGDRGLTYRHGGTDRAVMQKLVTVAVRQADGSRSRRTFTTYATHHGPVVRAEGDKWVAVSLMHRPVEALSQSFLRTKVSDIAGFRKVAALKANSSNNTLFASNKGEVALFLPQFMPLRDQRFDFTRPVDGSDPAADWKGLHALDTLPEVVNPANGWAFNVNDAPWWAAGKDSPRQGAYPRYLDTGGREPRTSHAIAVLSARPKFTLDELVAAAYDPWLPAFATLVPELVAAHAAAPDARRAEAVALLARWDKRWSLASTETSLAVFWADAHWAIGAEEARAQQMEVEDWIASKSTPAQKLAAFDKAIARLTDDFGSWQVPWGEINRFQRNDGAIVQAFDDTKPSTPVPFASANWGSLAAFGAQRYPGTKRYYGTYGNSFVAAVEFGPRVKARAVTAGGESGDPASPHFSDQAQNYADGNLRPVYFYPDDLAGHTRASKTVSTR